MARRDSVMYGYYDSRDIPEAGAIFLSNIATKKECYELELFGLPSNFASFVKNIKSGTILFLFEYERRELHGVFMARSDGEMDINPHAFTSSGKQFPAQVMVKQIWQCSPLSEREFRDAIRENYWSAKKFKFGLNKDQVQRLLSLFRSRKLKDEPRCKGFAHGRLERPIGYHVDRAEVESLCHKYSSSSNLVEKHGAGDVPPIYDEFMRPFCDRVRQSYSDGELIPQDVMEDDFGVENDPVVWSDNLDDISDRARRLPLVSNKYMGASFDRDRQSSGDGKFVPQALKDDDLRMGNDLVAMGRHDDYDNFSDKARRLTGDSVILAGDCMDYLSDMHRDIRPPSRDDVSQLRSNSKRSDVQFLTRDRLENSHYAQNNVGSANSFHFHGISRAGVDPHKSTSEADNIVCDLPSNYYSLNPQVSDINYARLQAASISRRALCYDANAWNNVRPTNSYHCPELSGPSVYPDTSTPEVDYMVSDRLKLTRHHSIELRVFDNNPGTSQEAPVTISSLPSDASLTMIDNNNQATPDVCCRSNLLLECANVDPHFGSANRKASPMRDLFEYSRPLAGKSTLFATMHLESGLDGTENGGQAFFSVKSDDNLPSEFPVNSLGGFDNILPQYMEDEVLNGDNSMPIDHHGFGKNFNHMEVQEFAGSDQITKSIYFDNHRKRSSVFSRLRLASDMDVPGSACHHLGDGSSMDSGASETLALLPRSSKQLSKLNSTEQYTNEELRKYRKHKFKPMLKRTTLKTVPKKFKMCAGDVEERKTVSKKLKMCAGDVEERKTISKKLKMCAGDVEESKSGIEESKTVSKKLKMCVGDVEEKNTSFEERKTVSKKLKMCAGDDKGRNSGGILERKTVLKKAKSCGGHLEERNNRTKEWHRDQDIVGQPSSESKGVSEKLEMNALSAVVAVGDSAAPFINFKRRRKSLKVQDIIEGRECERSKVLLSGQHKRRILFRPKFDTETSNDKSVDCETSNKIVVSSHECSLENDTSVNNCKISRVLLSGQRERRKLKRPAFYKETSNCKVINGDQSNHILLPSQKGLENQTSISFQGFLGTQRNDNTDFTYGCTDKTIEEEQAVCSILVTKSRVKDTLTDNPKVRKDITSSSGEGVTRVSKVDGFDNVASIIVTKDGFSSSSSGDGATRVSTVKSIGDLPSSMAIEDMPSSIAIRDIPLSIAINDVPSLSSSVGGVTKVSKVDGFQDVPLSNAIKDENWKSNKESQGFVLMVDKHTQGSIEDLILEKHVNDSSAKDISHFESDSGKGNSYVLVEHFGNCSNDVSVEHLDNYGSDKICLHDSRIGNSLTTNNACYLTLECEKKVLQACIDGGDEELLQLSLNTGSTNKRTSNQILKSLIPSEKQVPFGEDDDFLQLSLGSQPVATCDAANC